MPAGQNIKAVAAGAGVRGRDPREPIVQKPHAAQRQGYAVIRLPSVRFQPRQNGAAGAGLDAVAVKAPRIVLLRAAARRPCVLPEDRRPVAAPRAIQRPQPVALSGGAHACQIFPHIGAFCSRLLRQAAQRRPVRLHIRFGRPRLAAADRHRRFRGEQRLLLCIRQQHLDGRGACVHGKIALHAVTACLPRGGRCPPGRSPPAAPAAPGA